MNLVSIIIPVYNQEQYIAETLNSVLHQSYTNWECILVNDGSLDDSVTVIRQYTAQDSRFHFIDSKNKGVSNARNLALQQVKGDFILFLDGDDLIHPEKLQLAISNFEQNTNLSIVFNTTNYFQDTIENVLFAIQLETELVNFNGILLYWGEKITIPIHSAIIKKSLLEGIEFNCELTAQEDWLVWLRLFKNNPKVLVLDEVLSYYRKHNTSRTQTVSLKEDHFKALKIFTNYIDVEDYKLLLLHQVKRYYNKSYDSIYKLNAIKESKTYRAAVFLKKIAVKFKLLGIIKFLSAKFFKDVK
jgi:glycosyltransferase involved in cell wall biosynthesis